MSDIGVIIGSIVFAFMVTIVMFLESLIFIVRFRGSQFSINWKRIPLYWIGLSILFMCSWIFITWMRNQF